MKKIEKVVKGIYLTKEAIARAEKIAEKYSKEKGITVKFSDCIQLLIMEKEL